MATLNKTYKFAEFEVNPAKRTLFRNAEKLRLRDKDYDILLFLIENAPRVCSPDEIIEAVWNGTSVENNSIEKAIAAIRSVLGDNAKNPKFIKTVRAKGYLFIGELDEITLTPPVNFTEPQTASAETSLPENSKLKIAGLFLSLVVFAGVLWWNGKDVWVRYTSTVIFTDDFSSDKLDPLRWKIKGSTARVENGIAEITVAETDKGGRLESTLFSFDPARAVTINCRIKVSHSRNIRDKVYFTGYFGVLPKSALLHEADADINNHYMFGIRYMNYDYESKYPNGEIDEISTEGFFLIMDNGTPNKKIDYRDGKISKRIEPVWDEWFDQKLIYEPFSGKMSFFINGELKDEMNVGDLLKVLEENKLRLDINPSGWWVNHSIEIDYIEITQ